LTNTFQWIGQLILEEILQTPEKNDYIQAATTSAAKSLEWYQTTMADLEKERKPNTTAKDLKAYVGVFWNKSHTVKMVVTLEGNKLYYAVQGLDSEKYVLEHYEDDTFTWIRPRNELVSRGRWVDQGTYFWKIRFESDGDGNIVTLNWAHDVEIPEGEAFFRTKE
jgi:hypothetical protein